MNEHKKIKIRLKNNTLISVDSLHEAKQLANKGEVKAISFKLDDELVIMDYRDGQFVFKQVMCCGGSCF